MLRRKPISRIPLERWGRYLAGGLILVNPVMVRFSVSIPVGDDSAMQLSYPTAFTIACTLALMSGAGAIAMLASVVGAWRQKVWGIVAGLYCNLVTRASMYFIWYLIESKPIPHLSNPLSLIRSLPGNLKFCT